MKSPIGTRIRLAIDSPLRKRPFIPHKKFSEEVKTRLSLIHKGKIPSLDTRKRMSNTHKELGSGKWMLGRKLSEETKRKVGLASSNRKRTIEEIEKIRKANTGQKRNKEFCEHMSKVLTGRKIPRDVVEKVVRTRKERGYKHTEETRRKIGNSNKGEKSYFWRGGVTSESMRIRSSIDYKLWREAVFKRDSFTCQECNVVGKYLNAHHIKSFAHFPELRFSIDNGITLCVPCHKKTDTYLKNYKKQSLIYSK